MGNLRNVLPPLHALVMFDAAARHLSFTRASEELNLTQAAVSRQIRQLEENLGVKLFVRANRKVELSAEGRAFQHGVRNALMQLRDVAEEVRNIPQTSLTVAVDQAIGGLWLPRMLREFGQSNPGVSLRVIVSDDPAECLTEKTDVAILHGKGSWNDFESELIFPEEIFPVCRPSLLEGDGRVRSVDDLVRHAFIEHEDDNWDWMNWQVWLTMKGVALPIGHRKLLINNYPAFLQMACEGLGIGLGWRYFVDDYLREGLLVRPVAESVTTQFGYYLIHKPEDQMSRYTVLFADCARAVAAKTREASEEIPLPSHLIT